MNNTRDIVIFLSQNYGGMETLLSQVDSIYSSLPLEDYGNENERYATYEYDNEENIVRESAENKGSELEIDFADEQELQENVGKPVMTKVVSCVKQASEKGTEIICRLKDGIQAIIIENIK